MNKANFMISLAMMLKGMLGIFVVMGIILLAVLVCGRLFHD